MGRMNSLLNIISSFFSSLTFSQKLKRKKHVIVPFLLLGQFCFLPALLGTRADIQQGCLVSELQIIYCPLMPKHFIWPPQSCWHTALGMLSDKPTAARKRSINSCNKLRVYLVLCFNFLIQARLIIF